MKTNDKVWYACYGSNLCADRFKYYILGGDCPYNGKHYDGCDDKTMWSASKTYKAKGRIYFALSSRYWDYKGFAFYNPDADGTVFMKLYLITWGQFLDVQDQEGKCYDLEVPLGEADDGIPIYTFTTQSHFFYNSPSGKYLDVIRKGLINECGVSENEADAYLASALVNETG